MPNFTPSFLDCYCCLDNLYFALADYCRAQQLSPGDWEIRCRVAVTQCELGVKEFSGGNITEANKLFSGAICNNPKVSRFYLYRARLKFELKVHPFSLPPSLSPSFPPFVPPSLLFLPPSLTNLHISTAN